MYSTPRNSRFFSDFFQQLPLTRGNDLLNNSVQWLQTFQKLNAKSGTLLHEVFLHFDRSTLAAAYAH